MNPNSVNEFLPAAAGQRPHMDDIEEDEFDMAKFSAIRKEQKDELERLDHHHHNKQLQIENQIRAELDRLFSHFQQGMQNLYSGLTQTVNTTVESQVKLRMQQERLREEHASDKREVERRYHNEASRLVMSTSHAARNTKSFLRAPSSSLPVGTSGMPTPSGDRHISPAAAPVNITPPVQRQVMAKPAAIDPMPREYVGHESQHREFVVPYPTPQEPVPKQRTPVPPEPRYAEPLQVEPRPAEPRPAEPRPAEPRPAEPRHLEPRHVEPRPTEPRHVEPRPSEPRHIEPRHTEPRPVEPRPTEPHYIEPRPSEPRHVEPRRSEPRQVEPRHVEHRPAEPRPPEPLPAEPRHAEHRHIEPRPVENRPLETHNVQPMAARSIYEEPMPIEPQQSTVPTDARSSHQQERLSEASTVTSSRQETKRKAEELLETDAGVGGPTSKRSRTRDRLVEEAQDALQAPLKRSPRARRSSQAALETRVERTISFSEVYQNGKAQYKHKIFEYKVGSGNWYIVRCDEHQVHFGYGNPVHGAAKHVHSPQHGNLEKRHDLAIEVCGHRVLDCNAELADLNNREFERAVKEDKYIVFNMNLLTKEGRRRLTDGSQELPQANGDTPAKKKPKPPPLKSLGNVTIPEECKFYQGFWQPTKKWYMLIMLPIRPDGNLREVGLREKLQETDLMGNIPKCYRVDRISLQIKGWQPAYEDGGIKVAKREYPVMFFDSYRKHSVGWLSAQKLRAVDLDNPPEDIDKRGLSIAREWYAQHMMHRRSWEDLKKLGRGEPPSESSSSSSPDQWPSLRSAHTDDQSPIRDKSSGPGHFGFGSSSEEGSDEDDPMTMDVGPIPEAVDSNYVVESGPDDSDVDMEDARRAGVDSEEVNDDVRPGRANFQTSSSRPNSRRGAATEKDVSAVGPKKPGRKPDTKAGTQPELSKASNQNESDEAGHGPSAPSTNDGHGGNHGDQLSAMLFEQEHLRKSAQVKAAAAVKEAASRSRASSEVPENYEARPAHSSRPPFTDHHRSRSEDNSPLATHGISKLNEGRKPSDLHNILNTDQGPTPPEPANENHADPYKRFEAIKAQMNGLRSSSAPVHEGNGTDSPFSPPQTLSAPPKEVVQSPSLSHILSPPSQSTMLLPRSSSSTPVQESERSTPKIVIPGNADKWQAVRHFASAPPPPQSQNPRASFVNRTSLPPGPNGYSETGPRKLPLPTPQLGTPIAEKQEFFDVSQFRDTARGMRWDRGSPSTPFLRLIADPMRGWAETARGSPWTAAIEASKIARIEVDGPSGDRQKVQLMLKDGTEQMLLFETNSENGRSQTAALQARRFVSWAKKVNGEAELRNGAGSRRSSLNTDERQSSAVMG